MTGVTQMNVHDLIACPTCRARVDQSCRTPSGHTTTPHSSRLVPRLCPCGAALGARRKLCDTCRDANIRATKGRYQRVWRARRREEAGMPCPI